MPRPDSDGKNKMASGCRPVPRVSVLGPDTALMERHMAHELVLNRLLDAPGGETFQALDRSQQLWRIVLPQAMDGVPSRSGCPSGRRLPRC